MQTITEVRARKVLSYDSATGEIRWLVHKGARATKGSLAGSVHRKGYRLLHIDGRRYMAHRLAWLLTYGVWPTHGIDHINGIRDDNRIVNLRDVPQAINLQNLHGARSQSKTGVLGVHPHTQQPNTFVAQISVGGKCKHLGSFSTIEKAQAAYLAAKAIYHPQGNGNV